MASKSLHMLELIKVLIHHGALLVRDWHLTEPARKLIVELLLKRSSRLLAQLRANRWWSMSSHHLAGDFFTCLYCRLLFLNTVARVAELYWLDMLYHFSQLCNSEMLGATIGKVLLHRHMNYSPLILQLPLSLLLHPF